LNVAGNGYETSTVARPVRVHALLLFVLVAGGYALGSELAFSWFGADGTSSSFFPAAGVTLAALVVVAKRQWPIVLVAAGSAEFLIDLSHDLSAEASAGYVLANLTQPVVGATLLLAVAPLVDLGRTRDLAAFIAYAVILAPAVGGALGATTYVVIDGGEGWARFAAEWWVGDGLGVLVVAGAILAHWSTSAPVLTRRRALEGLVFAATGVLSALAVLRLDWFALVYVPIALLVVMAFRVGTRGVALMGAALAFVVAEATAEGHTFWNSLDISPATALVYLQLGMAVVIVSALALASEIAQRERIAGALARTEAEKSAALERASLYEAERAARETAELLERSASHLAEAVTGDDVARATLDDLASSGAIAVIGVLEGDTLRTITTSGVADELESRTRSLTTESPGVLEATLRANDTIVVASADEYERRFPDGADVSSETPVESMLGIPLRAGDGRVLGALVVASRERDAFGERRRRLVEAIARQCGLVLERAQLFEAERAARERAELLERHASRVAAAISGPEIAAATIEELETAGIDIAVMGVVRGAMVETIGTSGISEATRARYASFPLAERSVITDAIRSGETVVIGAASDYEERYPAFAHVRRETEVNAVVSIPLLGAQRNEVLGALAVSARSPDALGHTRRQLAVAVAEQAALALERAQLQIEADQAAADAALLAYLGEELELPTTTRGRAQELVRALADELGALSSVHLLDADGAPEIVAVDSASDLASVADDDLERLAASALASERSVLELLGGLRIHAIALRARARALGALTIAVRPEDTRVDAILLQRVATRAALALDNALLYERERDVSHSLQLSLLGGQPAPGRRTDVASAYLPATEALEIGGDWYDVLDLPGGARAFVVGDVVGHGLEAAKAMGQLRGAVRALAPIGSPTDLLRNLDLFVDSVPEASMATLAYVHLDPESGRIRYACAGHPPPLVVGPDGATRYLWDGRSTPLGCSLGSTRAESEDALAHGETVVLYTDGLVERRNVGLDAMLARLADAAREAAGSSPARLVDGVLSTMLADSLEDDVCMLAFRLVTADHFSRALIASPGDVAAFRRALDAWLGDLRVPEMPRRDLVLAVAEAAANAAEHAYGFDGAGSIRVDVRREEDGTLSASVTDEGTWREPVESTERGRGIKIMRALMDDVAISSDARGTVVQMRLPVESGVPT
jgi:serine/threonine-protein kinase RsbW